MLHAAGEAIRRGRFLILYQCVSHRVLRWLGGAALAGMVLAAPFLPAPLSHLALAALGVFFGAALAGFLTDRLGLRVAPLYLCYYLLVIHVAGLAGLLAFLLQTDRPYWEPRQ